MEAWPLLRWRPTGRVWREKGNSEVVFGQVKSEIHCEWTGEGRRVSRSVGLGCRERLRVEPGSPPLREDIERTVDVTESECLPGVQDAWRSVPSPAGRKSREKQVLKGKMTVRRLNYVLHDMPKSSGHG